MSRPSTAEGGTVQMPMEKTFFAGAFFEIFRLLTLWLVSHGLVLNACNEG